MQKDSAIRIFILKSRPSSLAVAEAYLKNRQWQIESSTSLKVALGSIIRNRPDHVLIGVEHPNKKIAMLPKLLMQAFGLRVIPYADSNSGSNALIKMQSQYSLYAPVSGPGIERLILKIAKEAQQKAIDEYSLTTSKGPENGGSGVMIFASEKDSNQAKDALLQFMKSDGEEEEPIIQPGIGIGDEHSATEELENYTRRKQKEIKYFSDQEKSGAGNSILAQAVSASVETSVKSGSGRLRNEVEQTSNVACVTIESSRFSGYLLCALGKNQKVEAELVHTIRHKLFRFLRQSGEQVKDHENIDIQVKSVDFVDWSIDQAQFLKKSSHLGNEMAMAFFPREKMGSEWSAPIKNGMAVLEIKDIPAETKLDFSLYIHLPENDKYLLYTPENSSLHQRQKDRLLARGVEKVYVKEEHLLSLKKFQTQQFLNEKINSYQQAAAS